MRKVLKITEGLGIIVLILVIVAFCSHPQLFYFDTILATGYVWLMFFLMSISVITSVCYLFTDIKIQPHRLLLGFSLVLLGYVIFFIYPQYLYIALNKDLFFWAIVSGYTLPAIAAEGGVFTLVTVFCEKNILSVREKYMITVGVIIYTGINILVNFLAIHKVIQVAQHIILAKISFLILVAVTAIYLLVFNLNPNNPSRRIW